MLRPSSEQPAFAVTAVRSDSIWMKLMTSEVYRGPHLTQA